VGNLGSTKPEIAAYLSRLPGVTVLARQGDTYDDINRYANMALEQPFDLILDNGAGMLLPYYRIKPDWRPAGAIEETRSGQLLLEQEAASFDFPVLVIDASPVKRLVENEAGVGQSVVDGFMRATSMLLGGQRILIVGYGFCGTGIAQRFRALGAVTMVCDTNPLRRLKARIEGHITGDLADLLPLADGVITATGRFNVIGSNEAKLLKNRAIMCNAGHYNMEIGIDEIIEQADDVKEFSGGITQVVLGGKEFFLLQKANPVNLAAGSGNPIEIMELGYALQLLSLEEIVKSDTLVNAVQPLPQSVNDTACRICLEAWE
jgi:adenosylhomocysteinase